MYYRNKVKIGIVKFFDSIKGCGFIKDMRSKQEFYVDFGNVINTIKRNDQVEFEVVKEGKRLSAIRVRVI